MLGIGHDVSACFFNEENSRKAIPGIDVGLEIACKTACRDVGQHQRARTVAVEHAARRHQPLGERNDVVLGDAIIGAHPNQPVLHAAHRINKNLLVIQPRTATLYAVIEIARPRRIDGAGNGFFSIMHGNRNAPVRQAHHERAGAVDRINDPRIAGFCRHRRVFFAHYPVIGKGDGDLLADQRFHIAVGNRHHILRIGFGFNRQYIAAQEIVEGQGPCLLGNGLYGDVAGLVIGMYGGLEQGYSFRFCLVQISSEPGRFRQDIRRPRQILFVFARKSPPPLLHRLDLSY